MKLRTLIIKFPVTTTLTDRSPSIKTLEVQNDQKRLVDYIEAFFSGGSITRMRLPMQGTEKLLDS